MTAATSGEHRDWFTVSALPAPAGMTAWWTAIYHSAPDGSGVAHVEHAPVVALLVQRHYRADPDTYLRHPGDDQDWDDSRVTYGVLSGTDNDYGQLQVAIDHVDVLDWIGTYLDGQTPSQDALATAVADHTARYRRDAENRHRGTNTAP